MNDDLPAKIRYITRKGKNGQTWGYYYWDGRSRGYGEVSLGSDRAEALELLAEYEAGAHAPPKRRRVVNQDPGWLALPTVLKDAYRGAMWRAAQCDWDCLTPEDLGELWRRSDGRCEVSGMVLELDNIGGPYMPSIDRIDSRRGYEKANCRIVCTLVNYAMNMWGEEPLLRVAECLLRRRVAESCGNGQPAEFEAALSP
jgi:hypothetical protein